MNDKKTAGKGRPTDYDPKYNALVKRLYIMGAIDKEVIESLDVARSTFYLWKQEHKKFAEAIREGKDFFDNNSIEESLKTKATGFYVLEEVTVEEDAEGSVLKTVTKQKQMPPDTAAIRYWLNNRNPERWRDKPEPDNNNSPDLDAERQRLLDQAGEQRKEAEELLALLDGGDLAEE